MCGFYPSNSCPFARGCVTCWPARETQRVQAGLPGGVLGTPVAHEAEEVPRRCVRWAGRRHSSRAGCFVSSCSHPACHMARNFRNLGERFGVSSTEAFPLGIWIWPLWLRAVSQRDQVACDFSLALVSYPLSLRVTFSIGCRHHYASLPGSDPLAEP